MHTKTCWLIGLAATIFSGAAQTASPPLPAAVAAYLKPNVDMCIEGGGKADASNAVKRVDLTADGIDDYLVEVGGIRCDLGASYYGDREKAVAVFVGDGKGGAKEAFNGLVFGAAIEGTGPAAKLWLDVMGQTCGKKPAKDFASESFCSRSLVWNAKTQKFDFAPVSTVRMIQ